MVNSKKWQTKGGFTREDSDDELGYDDHPWEWIYEDANNNNTTTTTTTSSRKRKASAISSHSTEVSNNDNDNDNDTDKKKRPVIVGARMGTFQVRVGDAVFLKSPEHGKDWAGLICAFAEMNEDGDDEMCAHIMWFCSPEELTGGQFTADASAGTVMEENGSTRGTTKMNKKKKKKSKIPELMSANETFITGDFNMNPLTAINGRAVVMGKSKFEEVYPGGQCPVTTKGKGKGKGGSSTTTTAAAKFMKTVLCRRAVKQRGLVFSEEFEWEDLYRGPEDLLALLDFVKESTRRRAKVDVDRDFDARREVSSSGRVSRDGEDDAVHREEEEDVDDDKLIPRTPKKKRKTNSVASTPRSSVKSSKFITPTHKRIVVKKALEITPLGTRILSPAHYMASPYSQARTTLHVSAVPTSLPCRTTEFTTVYNHLYSAIVDGSGACIYISGTPGTGKTATVREVVASLHAAVQNDELDDFNFVEINGMKVTEPHQSYSLLWEALKGDRVSPSNALQLLEHEFSHPSPRRIPCVVLMDELDQLVTKNQSVMYNFFNWPALRHSRLIVLAVANTMDLPERILSNKISSRLGLTRITFPGYTHTQLIDIISSRLEGVPGNIVDADAVQFASRKVAAVSGDARRALDICRRAVEIAEQQATEQNKDQDEDAEEVDDVAQTPSKSGRGKKNKTTSERREREEDADATPKAKTKPIPRVTIATIKQAINEATSSPIAQHLRSLPLASKVFLAALLARSRRTGVSDSALGDVLIECKRIADVAENQAIHDFLLVEYGWDDGVKAKEMPRVLAMGAAAMELVEAGIIAMDARSRGERAGKVRLRIGDEEVKSVLMNDPDVRGMGFGG